MEYEFKISLDDLVKMMAHKCNYCKFSQAQCSEKDGCEKGIRAFMLDLAEDCK